MKTKIKLLLSLAVVIFALVVVWSNGTKDNYIDYFSPSQIEWRFEAPDPITSTPAIDGKRIYVRTVNSVYALNTSTGSQLWRSESLNKSPLSLAPIIDGDYLIVPENDSRVAVFSTNEGQLVWRTPIIDPNFTHSAAVDIEAIAVRNNVLYVARFDLALTAYSLESGQILWEFDLSGRSNPYLAVDDNAIYLGIGSKLTALDLKNGNPLWEYKVEGYIGPMTIDENVLFVLDEEYSKVLAIDVNNHLLKWENILVVDEFEFNCIQVQSDKLYVSSQSLSAISKYTGQLIWQSRKTGRLECPVIWNDNIYIRNTNTSLFVFNSNLGEEIGSFRITPNSSMKHKPNRSPAISGELLIIPIKNNELVAVRLE